MFGKAALLLGATLISALVVEVFFRIFLPQNLIHNHSIVRADSKVEKRLVPDSTFEFASAEYRYTVKTNLIGFRDYDHELAKASDTRRILILGDSFTFGPGVEQDLIYPAVTERLLDLKKQKEKYEVLTMACGGYGPEHYQAVLETYGRDYQPDVVVVGIYVENDITDWLDLGPAVTPAQKHVGWLALHAINDFFEEKSHFFIFARARLDYPLWRIGLRPYYFPSVFFTPVSQELEKEWQKTYRALGAISAQCREIGAEFLVMLVPTLYQVSENVWQKYVDIEKIKPETVNLELPQERLVAFCDREGIECLDLLPHFRRTAHTESLYFQLDRHWNERGHELCAELLTERVDVMLRVD